MNQDKGPTQGSALDEAEPPPEVPNFTVFYCIGRGGFGRVWLARDVIGQWRAIKTVYRRRFNDDAQGARNYLRELGAVRRYAPVSSRHENLLKIFYVGPENPAEYFYYVMELADAEDGAQSFEQGGYKPRTLQSLVRAAERLPARQCVSIGLGLATALDELHRGGLLHRDIKPSNVIFVDGRPKLADIGLVEALGEASSRVGTEGYMPPEGPGQETADVFALGKVLYVASTGLEPGKFPDPPSSVWSEEGDADWLELSEVLVKACKPDPTQRYQSAAAMRQDLLLLEAKESLIGRSRWQRRRTLLKWFVAAALIAVLILGLIAWETKLQALQAGRLAAAEAFGRGMNAAQVSRMGLRQSGWTLEHSNHLAQAAQQSKQPNRRLLDEAATALAGLDLRLEACATNFRSAFLAFGPRGEVLFGGSAETDAQLYLPGENRFEALALKGNGRVGFDAQGNMLQFVSIGNGTLEVRDLRSMAERRRFSFSAPSLASNCEPVLLSATPDLSMVAAGLESTNGVEMHIWGFASGNELARFQGPITATAFAPDGSSFAAGYGDGQVIVWSLPDKQVRNRLTGRRAEVHALAFGRDAVIGSDPTRPAWLLAVGDGRAEITIYELASSNEVSRCRGSAYDVQALAFRSDGAVLASGGREVVWLWDVADGKPLLQTHWFLDDVRALAFSRDGHRLGVASRTIGGTPDPRATVWELEDGRGIQTLYGLGSRAELVWWPPDSHRIAALGQNWNLGIWSMPDGTLTHVIPLQPGGSQDNAAVAFREDGKWLAVAAGKEVNLYDLDAHIRLQTWPVPKGYSDSLRFEGTNRLFFLHRELDMVPGLKSAWVLRDLLNTNWPPLRQTNVGWIAYGTALPRGADFFLVWGGPTNGSGSSVKAVSIDTGSEKWERKGSRRYQNCSVVLDPTARLLGWSSGQEQIELYDLPDLRSRRELILPDHYPAAISPLGEWFANSDGPGWYIFPPGAPKSGVQLCMDFHAIGHAEFSPDGTMLAMPTAEGQILVADLKVVNERLRKLGWIPR